MSIHNIYFSGEIRKKYPRILINYSSSTSITVIPRYLLRTPPSVHLSHYLLLNHWAEFNKTRSMTSSPGKSVRDRICLSVRPSVRHAISS